MSTQLGGFVRHGLNIKPEYQVPLKRKKPLLAVTAGAKMNGNSSQNPKLSEAAAKYGWQVGVSKPLEDKLVREIPVAAIRRPLQGIRVNDREKVDALKESIQEIGLLEPIDVLEVDGQIYGFSGCHRYQAHVELGKSTILCRVRKATKQVLRYHMM